MSPKERMVALARKQRGYHHGIIDNVTPGSRYLYRLDGSKEYPDPASQYQPNGVHGPSEVVNPHFPWEDASWPGLSLEKYIIYELHVGTYTKEGTFEAIVPHLDRLNDLGVTTLELMPVVQFPGNRNWGYDGTYPFAAQNTYGGPEGLKILVNACHQKGLAIVLDVVYNHLGPEGNYISHFGPYFTKRYQTPWGAALNFDGPNSDEVRQFFIQNAVYWLTEFHMDALRLDALHAIMDMSSFPFLEELANEFHKQASRCKRQAFLIAESAANDVRMVKPSESGGYGLDSQWNDDFHHSLHVLLTGEQNGYYQDFGQLQHLTKAFREGFVYSGQYSPYRQKRHGRSSQDIPAHRLVVFTQNHDQVGNRMIGDRLSQLVSFEALKLAASAVLLSPFIPLIFMGEEYGEKNPFPYFVSHSAPDLIEAVRKGRHDEFATFNWQGELPDPQDETTYYSAKLNHHLYNEGQHRILHTFYRELIQLRKRIPAITHLSKDDMDVQEIKQAKIITCRRWYHDSEVVILFCFNNDQVSTTISLPEGHWRKQLDSAEIKWQGPGSIIPEELNPTGTTPLTLCPWAAILFLKET